jgi:multidrug transporter EmrE-like cation transporter
MNKLTLIGAATLAAVAGDYFIKRYSMQICWKYALGIIVFYAIGTAFYTKMVMVFGNLARASNIWTFAYTAAMLCLSQLVFKEHLNAQQWAGVVLGVIAVALML